MHKDLFIIEKSPNFKVAVQIENYLNRAISWPVVIIAYFPGKVTFIFLSESQLQRLLDVHVE